jgi:hypothetical protein
VETAILQGRVLYLNLSAEVFSTREPTMLDSKGALDLMREAIRMNFPKIQAISVFVDSQSPRF